MHIITITAAALLVIVGGVAAAETATSRPTDPPATGVAAEPAPPRDDAPPVDAGR